MNDGVIMFLALLFLLGIGLFLFTGAGLSLLGRLLAPTKLKPSA